MSDDFRSVAFIVPSFQPGKCGVSDHVRRMILLLSSRGVVCGVIAQTDEAGNQPDGTMSFAPENLKRWDVLAIQYVPRLWRGKRGLVSSLARVKGKVRFHLMVHEFWRFSYGSHKVPLKQRLPAFYEFCCLQYLHKRLAPQTTSTSNVFYQRKLIANGIPATVSPMPSTIAYDPAPHPNAVPPKLAALVQDQPDAFLWLSFGGLYTDHWSQDEMMAEMRKIQSLFDRPFWFVLAGMQLPEEIEKVRKAASEHQFEGRILELGPLDEAGINGTFAQCHAYFTGVDFQFWERSSTALAASEQGIPVYFVRGLSSATPGVEMMSFFSSEPLKIVGMPRPGPLSRSSVHHPDNVSRVFIDDFLVKNPAGSAAGSDIRSTSH